MDKNYKGLIWTNHALQRMQERNISQGDVWATWSRPEQSRYATSKGSWIYYRTYGNVRIEVVAKKNEKGEWIIISVWSKIIEKVQSPPVYQNRHKWLTILFKLFKVNNGKEQ